MADKVGRPLLFKTAADMQVVIDAYFDQCDKDKDPYTMSGLAYALDMDRRTLLDYSNRDEFLPTVKRARNRVELYVEKLMLKSNGVVAGVIFNAKNNFGWHDKQEVEQSGEVKHTYDELDDEQLEAALKAREDRISKAS